MQAQSLLDRVRVASPCSARWEDMEGDDRARFCGQCRNHVFNFSAMTRDEAEALIREKEGRLCGRFYRRRDGHVLTADCPVGRGQRRRRLAQLGGFLFATVLVTVCSRVAARSQEQPPNGRSRFFAKVDELVYWAKVRLGLVKPAFSPSVTMGVICISSQPPLTLSDLQTTPIFPTPEQLVNDQWQAAIRSQLDSLNKPVEPTTTPRSAP